MFNTCLKSYWIKIESALILNHKLNHAGQMQRPAGVTVLQNGNFAVADYDNKCVSVYEPNGKFVNRIGAGKLLGIFFKIFVAILLIL